jgi:hypothetical protein
VDVGDLLPIEGRDGWVGGIESLVVDGRRWYFGFDYSSDLVLSPLIDDETTMSEFAGRYMSQRDGAHDAAYWRELVDDSVTVSDLTEEDDHREFTSEGLAAQRLSLGDYLWYLLGAADGVKADAGRLLMTRFIETFLENAPGNWPVVFSALRA